MLFPVWNSFSSPLHHHLQLNSDHRPPEPAGWVRPRKADEGLGAVLPGKDCVPCARLLGQLRVLTGGPRDIQGWIFLTLVAVLSTGGCAVAPGLPR